MPLHDLPKARPQSSANTGFLAALPLLFSFTGCGPAPGDGARGEWPQFRGPGGHGHAAMESPPLKWATDSPNIRWKTEIPGVGNSSPVVSNGQVYLTTVVEAPAKADAPPLKEGEEAPAPELERSVVAVDLKSGKLLWRTAVFTAPPYQPHFLSTDATPSVVADGKTIFAFFGHYLAALDREGKILWKKEVDPDYMKEIRYGVGSSPILTDKAVIVVRDKEFGEIERDTGWMGAFDRKTGEELWRVTWKDNCCSYVTPLVNRREGFTEIFLPHTAKMTGYDADTGEVTWNHLYPMLQPVGSGIAQGNVYCYMGGAHLDRGNMCVKVTGRGPEAKVEQLWFVPNTAPESASPVLFDGALWAVNEAGVLMMYDFATGKLLERKRLEGQYFRSSIVVAGGHLFVHSTSAHTTVVKPTADKKNFEILGTNFIDDQGNNASLAFGGGCLLMRGHKNLFCVEKEKA